MAVAPPPPLSVSLGRLLNPFFCHVGHSKLNRVLNPLVDLTVDLCRRGGTGGAGLVSWPGEPTEWLHKSLTQTGALAHSRNRRKPSFHSDDREGRKANHVEFQLYNDRIENPICRRNSDICERGGGHFMAVEKCKAYNTTRRDL